MNTSLLFDEEQIRLEIVKIFDILSLTGALLMLFTVLVSYALTFSKCQFGINIHLTNKCQYILFTFYQSIIFEFGGKRVFMETLDILISWVITGKYEEKG